MDAILRKEVEDLYNSLPQKRFVVHNGFFSWSYGSPQDPMIITLRTAISLLDYIFENKTDESVSEDKLIEMLHSGFPHFVYADYGDFMYKKTHGNRILSFVELGSCIYTIEDRGYREYVFDLEYND